MITCIRIRNNLNQVNPETLEVIEWVKFDSINQAKRAVREGWEFSDGRKVIPIQTRSRGQVKPIFLATTRRVEA